jgi:alkylhydroperoxidase family enzyme
VAWAKTLNEDEVSGSLRQAYDAELARLGFVMEATKALSSTPDLAAAFETFTSAVKHASGLTPQERRLISLLVAQRLRSTYCVLVYATEVERDLGGLDRVRAVGLDDRAIIDVAVWANLGAFRSRIYDALGVQTDPFFLEQADLVEAVALSTSPA